MAEYTSKEMMAIAAGRLINDGDLLFAGTGLSMLAATVANGFMPQVPPFFSKRAVSIPACPNCPWPWATPGDDRSQPEFRAYRSLFLFGASQAEYGGFFGRCPDRQIRQSELHGNRGLQTPHIPSARIGRGLRRSQPGFVGHHFHEARKAPLRGNLDYFTSPGWLEGGDTRKKAGYRRGGPTAVVTDLGIMKFQSESKKMFLAEFYPGVDPGFVADQTGFPLDVSAASSVTPPTGKNSISCTGTLIHGPDTGVTHAIRFSPMGSVPGRDKTPVSLRPVYSGV